MTQVTLIATNWRGETLEVEGRLGMDKLEKSVLQRGQQAMLPVTYGDEKVAEYRIDFVNDVARIEFISEDSYRSVTVKPGKRLTLTAHTSMAWGCMLPLTLLSLSGLLVGGILL